MLTNRVDLSAKPDTMRGLHWAGIAMALISGVVHFVLGLQFLPHAMGFAFLIAAAGFAVGSWLVIADVQRTIVYTLGVPFTLGQIGAWIALTRPELVEDFDLSVLGAIEIVDKTAQILLLIVLVVLYVQEQ